MNKSFLFFLYMLLSLSVRGQYNAQQPPVLPKAPNTAKLDQFGNYPVNLFSGLVNISIPLYTIKTQGFEVPISLNYHAGGLKVNDFPSLVGNGWALDAGGQVSRSLVGRPDEQAHGFLHEGTRTSGSLYPNNQADIEYLQALNSGYRDVGPDVFSYSFPGGGGKFFFDSTALHRPVLIPFSPIRINYPPGLSALNFDITDAGGNSYEFGKVSTEFSKYSTGTGAIDAGYNTTAWMLEKMISHKIKDTVSFTYQYQHDVTPTEFSDKWTIVDLVDNSNTQGAPNSAPYAGNSGSLEWSMASNESFSGHIQQITFKNGRVVFELGDAPRQDFDQLGNSKALRRIKVYKNNADGEMLLQTFILFHGYSGVSTSKRLRLDSIQLVDGKNNNILGSYRFEYNETITLPAYDSRSKDYWGYFNGRGNSSLIPKTDVIFKANLGSTPTTISIGNNTEDGREASPEYMQAGILKRIWFPTKGHTDFSYETNRYLDAQQQEKYAGGLRIKAIKSYDGLNTFPNIKTYEYGPGRANFFLNQSMFSTEQKHEFWQQMMAPSPNPTALDQPYIATAWNRTRTFFASPTISTTPADGSIVVYPFVTEFYDGGVGAGGKTEYRYRDVEDDIYSLGIYSSKGTVVSKSFGRGQLVRRTDYKKVSAGYQPIQDEVLTYDASTLPLVVSFAGLQLVQRVARDNLQQNFGYTTTTAADDWYYNNYYFQVNDNYPTGSVQKMYDQSDSTKYTLSSNIIEYGNPEHQQVTKSTKIDSDGSQTISEYRFPADFRVNNGTTGYAIFDYMLNNYFQAVQVEGITKKGSGAIPLVIHAEVNDFTVSNALVRPSKYYRLNTATPISNYQQANISGGNLAMDSRQELRMSNNLFDSQGNVLEVQSALGSKESFLWSYRGAYLVARVKGMDFNTLRQLVDTATLNNFSITGAQVATQLTNLRSLMLGYPGLMDSFTWSPLSGVATVTNPAGHTSRYSYDGLGRLTENRDDNDDIEKFFTYHYSGVENTASYCPADWQNTTSLQRCRKNTSNQNTGWIEQEQRDMSFCSYSYNETRWIAVSYNVSGCPLPQPPGQNCPSCTGADQRCINGNCETGIKTYLYSEPPPPDNFMWTCYYRYEFSDGSWSETYSELSSMSCTY